MIKIGLVGVGNFAKFLLEIVSEMSEVKIEALSSRNNENLLKVGQDFKIAKTYTNYLDMLADKTINLIWVCTPPSAHLYQVSKALEYGKHVLVEKPSALNVKDLDKLIAQGKRAGLMVAANHVMRFNEIYNLVGKLVFTSLLGDIQRIELNNLASDGGLDADHWFWDKAQSGGIFIEHSVHFFDIYYRLFGKPKLLSAQTYTRRNNLQIEDRAFSTVEYPNNIYASFFHSFDRPPAQAFAETKIYSDRGYVTIEGWSPEKFSLNLMLELNQIEQLRKILPEDSILAVHEINHEVLIKSRVLFNPVLVKCVYESPKSIREIYKDDVKALLRNLASSINNNLEPETSLERVRDSLRIAEESATFAAISMSTLSAKMSYGSRLLEDNNKAHN